jgi:PAS domain S-box-containing protein
MPSVSHLEPDFLAAALNVARIGICFVDHEGCFIEVNPAFCELTGFAREELIGRPWTIAAPADIAINAGRFLRAVLSDSARLPGQWKIRRKDGGMVEALVSFRPLTRGDGRRCAVLTFADLTARISEHTERIRRHRDVLLGLAALDKSDKGAALERILAADARTLDIERVSYWSLEDDGAAIRCEALYILSRSGTDAAFAGTRLQAADYPTYFAALLGDRPIAANDAQSDPATREFAPGYLGPLGITSMLDVPVWFQGKVVGVICHEHIGPVREWSGEDIAFASSAASMISLAHEQARWEDAMKALTRSEEKYRQVVENANEAIAVVQDGRIRYANLQCTRLSGFTLEELYARPFLDFVHGEDAPLVMSNYLKRMRGEDADASYEFRIIDKAGLTRWVHINAVAMEWDSRPATLNFLTDVTERHELQENLRRSLAEREVILKTAPVGISFASSRRHRWVNDAFAAMLGYDKSELVGQSSRMHFDDHESWETFGAEAYPVLASGGTYVTERLMKRKDGSRFWCQVSGNAVDPGDLARGSIWINVDVTERHRAEQEILRALEKERELNELKSRFVAMTSHEFRTPLATILSSSELLEQYGARLPGVEQQALHQSIRAGVERMTRMLDNVLIIGRSEAQMLEFQPVPTDLAGFCARLVEEMKMAAGGGHSLDYSFEGARRTVSIDEKLLRHVLVNLISNAFKYSPQGGTVRFRVSLGSAEAGFEVADRGIGIPAEDQPRLFETFHRARNVGNISGTGLGLAIVKKSLDLHGGTIRFDSAPGRGTQFSVTIPLDD